MRFTVIALFALLALSYQAIAQDVATPYPNMGGEHPFLDPVCHSDESRSDDRGICCPVLHYEFHRQEISDHNRACGPTSLKPHYHPLSLSRLSQK